MVCLWQVQLCWPPDRGISASSWPTPVGRFSDSSSLWNLGSLLDVLLVSCDRLVSEITSLPPVGLSDHIPLICNLNVKQKDVQSNRTDKRERTIWSYDRADQHEVNKALEEADWAKVQNATDIDSAWDAWQLTFFGTIRNLIPSKTIRKISPKNSVVDCVIKCAIGPLRIDVTVTAKWPLWVLRNGTPFTPSHFRQRSEQIFLVLVFVFLKTVFWNLFPMLCEQHIWKAKHFLDIFLTDSSQKVLVLPLRRHAGAANNARTSHFSRIITSVAWTDFQRQPRADDWPATRSRRIEPAGEFRVCELAPQCMARLLLSMSQRWFLPCCSSWLTL